jgi:large subunit ribosomal protein L13
MRTYTAKPKDIERKWYIIDAKGQVLGRLATRVADVLRGKNKAIFTPSVDCGDYVVVINTAKIAVTGSKLDNKKYYSHSGYPGGIKEATLSELLVKNPNLVIEKAVKGMLPKNKLADDIIKKMKLYPGNEHNHTAQKPEKIEIS